MTYKVTAWAERARWPIPAGWSCTCGEESNNFGWTYDEAFEYGKLHFSKHQAEMQNATTQQARWEPTRDRITYANDLGDRVALYASTISRGYVELSLNDVRGLRDWLTTWIEQRQR